MNLLKENYYQTAEIQSDNESSNLKGRVIYSIDLAHYFKDAIYKGLSIWACLVYLFLKIIGFQLYARKYVIKQSLLGRDGLYGLNKGLIHYSSVGVKQVMDILAKDTSFPVIVHCTAGKDRTGFIIALLQRLSGVHDVQIISQYAKSAEMLQHDMTMILAELEKQGLSSEFSKSPPGVMEATLNYIDKEFGSVEGYLSSIGVHHQQQLLILKNIFNSKLKD